MALVLELLAGRRDVRVPDLGHPAPGELDLPFAERRLELQKKERLLDVQNRRHSRSTVAVEPSAARCRAARSGVAAGAALLARPRAQPRRGGAPLAARGRRGGRRTAAVTGGGSLCSRSGPGRQDSHMPVWRGWGGPALP